MLGEVLDRGADDALVVDALVLVEALILDGHRRLAHHLGDLLAVDGLHEVVGLDSVNHYYDVRLKEAWTLGDPGARSLTRSR